MQLMDGMKLRFSYAIRPPEIERHCPFGTLALSLPALGILEDRVDFLLT
jgi:hypothetical protein